MFEKANLCQLANPLEKNNDSIISQNGGFLLSPMEKFTLSEKLEKALYGRIFLSHAEGWSSGVHRAQWKVFTDSPHSDWERRDVSKNYFKKVFLQYFGIFSSNIFFQHSKLLERKRRRKFLPKFSTFLPISFKIFNLFCEIKTSEIDNFPSQS